MRGGDSLPRMKQGLDIATKALALCAGAFLFGSTAWAKDEPVSMPRMAKWIANYDKDSCQLISQFGTAEKPVILRLTQYEPDTGYVIDLIGKAFRAETPYEVAKLAFGPNGNEQKMSFTAAKHGDLPVLLGRRMGLASFPIGQRVSRDEFMNQSGKVSSLTITRDSGAPIKLELGAMAGPIKAMETCIDSLLESWGYDAAIQKTLSRRATVLNNPSKWLSAKDYPSGLLRGPARGIVQFRLDIDDKGVVAGCSVLRRTNPDEFADRTCKLITERAQFLPALDSKGRPVKTYFVNRADWVGGRQSQ